MLLLPLMLLGQWESPVRMTHNDSASHTSFNNVHCLAGSGTTIHLVFYDHRTGVDQVWYMRSTDNGTVWPAETALTSGLGMKVDPSVAVAGDTVHVVWEDSRNGYNSEVYYLRSTDNGATWDPEQRLTNDNYMSRNPCVAVCSSNVYLAWANDTVGREIFFQRSTDNGSTWADRRRLTFDMQESWNPSLAAGWRFVHLAWRDWRDHSFEVYYLRSTDYGASWDTTAVRLSGDSATGSYNPCIACTESGWTVHVIWWDCRHMPFELYYRRSTDGGESWYPEVRLTTDTTGTYNPSIAACDASVYVAWEALYGSSFLMYKFNRSYGGGRWSDDTTLTRTPEYWSVSPCVAVLGAGVHVVWTDFRDSDYGEIYYMRDTTANTTTLKESAGLHVGVGTLPSILSSLPVPARRAGRVWDASGRLLAPGAHPGPGVYFLDRDDGRRRAVLIR